MAKHNCGVFQGGKKVDANSAQLSFTGTELYRCEISISCNAKFCNFWIVAMVTGVDRG